MHNVWNATIYVIVNKPFFKEIEEVFNIKFTRPVSFLENWQFSCPGCLTFLQLIDISPGSLSFDTYLTQTTNVTIFFIEPEHT